MMYGGGSLKVLPLDALSSDAAEYAESQASYAECCFSAVVFLPDEGVAYEFRGDSPAPLLSIVKVPIMLTLMDQAIKAGRAVTPEEVDLLDDMIRRSDNIAADQLWFRIGGAAGLSSFLNSVGVTGIQPDPDRWGATRASPIQASMLFGMLVEGKVLDDANRALALTLLTSVDPEQDWGSPAGARNAAETGVKNGWFPEPYGWSLNSLGFVVPEDGSEYVIAIFSSGAEEKDDGIRKVEKFARIVNQELLSEG
jgi:hypothetical protein